MHGLPSDLDSGLPADLPGDLFFHLETETGLLSDDGTAESGGWGDDGTSLTGRESAYGDDASLWNQKPPESEPRASGSGESEDESYDSELETLQSANKRKTARQQALEDRLRQGQNNPNWDDLQFPPELGLKPKKNQVTEEQELKRQEANERRREMQRKKRKHEHDETLQRVRGLLKDRARKEAEQTQEQVLEQKKPKMGQPLEEDTLRISYLPDRTLLVFPPGTDIPACLRQQQQTAATQRTVRLEFSLEGLSECSVDTAAALRAGAQVHVQPDAHTQKVWCSIGPEKKLGYFTSEIIRGGGVGIVKSIKRCVANGTLEGCRVRLTLNMGAM